MITAITDTGGFIFLGLATRSCSRAEADRLRLLPRRGAAFAQKRHFPPLGKE